MNKTLYEILGLDSSIDQKSIAPAFRNRIREVHPDKFQSQNNL